MIDLTTALADGMVPMQAIPEAAGGALGVGLAVGLAGLGAGYAERGIGSAAVGALAEDSTSLGVALLMTVIPETIVIFAFVLAFLLV